MRILPLLLFLPAACSSHLPYVASRTVEFTLPAAGVDSLQCTSHNGAILVTGAADCSEVKVRVDLSVRGATQAEADDNLTQLEVVRGVDAGTVKLAGKAPDKLSNNHSPSFAFTVTVPRDCKLALQAHNGAIEARGTRGNVALVTHNGRVVADVETTAVKVVTHNGAIDLTARGNEPIAGQVETHNGSVRLALAEGASSTVRAQTHNGGIDVADGIRADRRGRTAVDATYGNGEGKLEVSTHNGGVSLQKARKIGEGK